jgi:hypothetical protein
MNEQQAREEFAHYYEAVKESQRADGGAIPIKSELWEAFISHKIDEEQAPEAARGWKMPRSTKK